MARLRRFFTDERGSFGVKEIAITVAVIVVIGAAIGIIKGNLGNWIDQVWTIFIDKIKDVIS